MIVADDGWKVLADRVPVSGRVTRRNFALCRRTASADREQAVDTKVSCRMGNVESRDVDVLARNIVVRLRPPGCTATHCAASGCILALRSVTPSSMYGISCCSSPLPGGSGALNDGAGMDTTTLTRKRPAFA